MKHTLENYRDGYLQNWHDMTIRPARAGEARRSAERILANRERYEAVEAKTGVPWFVVGIIHKMECDLSFAKHIHNGDPLTRRTRLVPAGRPATGSPPFTWEESAIDALTMKGKRFDLVKVWDLPRIAYSLELYNGFGYRKFGVPSPYLWSFSTVYSVGKYVADGVWSPSAVSQQSGALVLLRVLCDMSTEVRRRVDAPEPPPPIAANEAEQLPATPSRVAGLLRSKTLFGGLVAAIGVAVQNVADWIGAPASLLADIASEAGGLAASLGQITGLLGWSFAGIGTAAILYGVAVVIYARASAEGKGKVA